MASKTTVNLAQVCISTLARLAGNEILQETISNADGVSILSEWLGEEWAAYPRVQEAALDSLSSLCRGNTVLASSIGYHKGNYIII
jgi:hypothetical protein